MLTVQLTSREVNLFLRDVEGWRYEGGCLVGRVKLPLGAVRVVVVPAQQGDYLVLSIPFDQVKGDITGGLMGQVVKMAWKFIQDKVTQKVEEFLYQQRLPRDTVAVEKRGSVGVVAISMRRLNEWLGRYPLAGSLRAFLTQVTFEPGSVQARLGLDSPGR